MRVKSCLVVALLMLGCGWVALADDAKAEKPAPKTILFLGDSITAAGGYVREIAADLEKQSPGAWRVVNHGKSSETVSNLSEAYHPGRRPCALDRLDNELKQNKPDWVVACYGMNDGIYHPFKEERFDAYKAGIAELSKKVHAAGARLILLTPPPFAHMGPFPEGSDDAAKQAIVDKASAEAEIAAGKDPNKFGYRSPFEYYDYVLAGYSKWLLTVKEKDVWTVDIRTPMASKVKETHGRDPIHPNALGHTMMAEAFMKEWPKIREQAGK